MSAACLYRATTISSRNGATVLARTHATASAPARPLIVAAAHGRGRVVVLADSDLFGDDCIDELDHRALWLNICYWVARRRPDRPVPAAVACGRRRGPGLDALRDETNALALLQAPDGSLAGDPDERRAAARGADRRGDRGAGAAVPAPAPNICAAAVEDLRAWAKGLRQARLHPRARAVPPRAAARGRDRAPGVFPMYKQNGSRDTCFEALIVRVPWPDWIAELERTRYDNPKFVPVELVDCTRGYDSECAALFPETVSVAGRPVNNFGAIFCDREAERLRRVAGAAADLLRSTCRPTPPACCQPGDLAAGLHPLGPDPRPGPQPRRPAVRPVHDPPAGAVLDVLARGAPLRPDRVQARRSSWSARASRSRATSSTRSCSTGCCASRSPARACATTTGSAASCCSPTCTATATCTGPTTS